MTFATAKDFFQATLEASRDAERIYNQLQAMESRAMSPMSPSFEAHVTGGERTDRTAVIVALMVDRERELRQRMEQDYALIDRAHEILYGDGTTLDGGLQSLVGWRADALALHYIDGMTWAQTGEVLGYTEQHVWQQAQVALEVADANGMAHTIAGRGMAVD